MSSTVIKSVVVIGGGSAGTVLAKSLSSSLDADRYTLTLITSRPFFIHYPATIRLTTSSQHDLGDKAFIPYDQLLKGVGSVVVGTVTKIEKHSRGGEVVLQSGERVKFDVLALAPGSKWGGPQAFPERHGEAQEWIESWRTKIAVAKNIVLVGGGAIGSEYAGEIKDVYPDTNVTIVHGGSQLLNDAYPNKFRSALEKSLRARGVKILLNEYVDAIPESNISSIKTRSGKTITADLVLSTRGARPNTDFVSSLGAGALSEAGYVKVRPTLQLLGHPDIFALGDVLDFREQKQAAKVYAHAKVVGANILSVLRGKEATSVYKGSYEMIVVTNGKNGGVSYLGVLWGIVLGNWFSRLVKSRDLLIPMARSSMGLSN